MPQRFSRVLQLAFLGLHYPLGLQQSGSTHRVVSPPHYCLQFRQPLSSFHTIAHLGIQHDPIQQHGQDYKGIFGRFPTLQDAFVGRLCLREVPLSHLQFGKAPTQLCGEYVLVQ